MTAATFSALAAPSYRTYLTGQVFANTGMWMASIAQDWLVLEMTGSSAAVGITMAMSFLPMLLFGVYGGVIADRYPKRRILLATQSCFAVVQAVLAAVCLLGYVRAWQVWVLALAGGFVFLVDNPARQVFVHEIVDGGDIRNAIALNGAVLHATRLVGPAVGALLVSSIGAGWAFAVNAACCVVPVVTLLRLHPVAVAPPAPRGKGQLLEGLRYVRRHPQIARIIVMVATVGMMGLNFPIVLTAMAREFGRGAGTYGMFNVVLALGSVAGALWAAGRSRARTRQILLAALVFGLTQAGAAFAPDLGVFVLLLVPMALANLAFQALANSRVQLATEPEYRGRVMAIYMLVFIGTTPLGAPLVGAVTSAWGPRAGMALCGLVPAVVAVALGAFGLRGAWASVLPTVLTRSALGTKEAT
ncbi:putative MFS family arabinose efflux permease [Motilibacter rhizosphaerae]|uniref:Putative MFS family arabinose efflux permease n=1 Tax=Motilibacter rhizosphaerae TaxID=598652 RepID=A0A4Q7NSD1_9ACTN|nr:MFS transporter [Motilibacter rhizosphaerae]RZS89678.1 putative MFS family arabinose efflux permease [Motilibacter rhizosphaerae]